MGEKAKRKEERRAKALQLFNEGPLRGDHDAVARAVGVDRTTVWRWVKAMHSAAKESA